MNLLSTNRLQPDQVGWLSPVSPILTYHIVAPEGRRYIYTASCRQFEEHLEWLSARSAGAVAHGQPTPEVTFDDGKASDHEFALPLLERSRIRATFFVTCGRIETEPGFMTWKQVRHIASLGHAVQSHGWSHSLLTRVNAVQLAHELEWSKKELEDRLGMPVLSLSLPGGRWTPRVLDACVEAGYLRIYHSNPFGTFESPPEITFLGRLMVRNSMDAECLEAIIRGGNLTALYHRARHGLGETGKRILGDSAYHWLWKHLAASERPTLANDLNDAGLSGPRRNGSLDGAHENSSTN